MADRVTEHPEYLALEADFIEACRQRDVVVATVQGAFEAAGEDGVAVLGALLGMSGEAEMHRPDVFAAIAAVVDGYKALYEEHMQLQHRVEHALAGLRAANVYDGTTSRILRGVQ